MSFALWAIFSGKYRKIRSPKMPDVTGKMHEIQFRSWTWGNGNWREEGREKGREGMRGEGEGERKGKGNDEKKTFWSKVTPMVPKTDPLHLFT